MADDKHKGHKNKNKNKKRESGCNYNKFADKFRRKKVFVTAMADL